MMTTGASPSAELTNEGPWKCFHCWETFTDVASAAQHFGPWPENYNFPQCAPKRWRETITQLRELTAERDALQKQLDEAHRLYRSGQQYQMLIDERDELAALAKRRLDLINAQADAVIKCGGHVDELRQERDALLLDARRYRFIRDHATTFTYSPANGGDTVWQIRCGVGASNYCVDDAIDKALHSGDESATGELK